MPLDQMLEIQEISEITFWIGTWRNNSTKIIDLFFFTELFSN